MLTVGDLGPEFELPDQHGTKVRLLDLRGKPVVLFFFPKSGSAVCTKEACLFQAEFPKFEASHAQILGISRDSVDSQAQFAARNGLEIPILSDKDGLVTTAYKVPIFLGIVPARVTYVLDQEGIVRAAFRNDFRANAHVAEAMVAIRALSKP